MKFYNYREESSTAKLDMTKEDFTHQLDLLNDLKKTLNRPTQVNHFIAFLYSIFDFLLVTDE